MYITNTELIEPRSLTAVPAHLWIGPEQHVRYTIHKALQRELCANGGCNSCPDCNAINQEQHHAVMWIQPEKQYTRDVLAPLFGQLSFALDHDKRFFFVLESVDFMPSASANSLLKSLEEPPSGYHFILSAQRSQTILPTIRSRCLIHKLSAESSEQHHPLFEYFTTTTFYDPSSFLKELDSSKINERESVELLDQIFAHWMQATKKAVQEKDAQNYRIAHAAFNIISHAFKKLPMPGSSKLFWKNLYVGLKSL